MKPVGLKAPRAPDVPQDIELLDPTPHKGRDLPVRVRAVSINPVDTKGRQRAGALEGEEFCVPG
ncbi:hypothetical protein [Asaia sp. HN010]|uniref:hypothetical protein n=1 Tax=Asaia sp. HN010 TaxID=3081233 RepID=UPI00301B48B9